MKTLRAIVYELLGLFLEDASLAFGIVAVVAAGFLLLPRLPLDPGAQAVVLIGLLCALLLENVYRKAKHKS